MAFFAVKLVGGLPTRDNSVRPQLSLGREIPTTRRRARPRFKMPSQFGYEDTVTGDSFIVPADAARSETDLASVPAWLGWVASKTGRNLPAALLHDVLIVKDPGEVNHWLRSSNSGQFELASVPYDPKEADRIFRDAMRDVGVDPARRWILWAAVSISTLWKERPKGWWSLVSLPRAAALAVLGLFCGFYLSLAFLFDVFDVEWGWQFPWIAEGTPLFEISSAVLVLVGLGVLATMLFGFGTKRQPHWQLGGIYVLSLFVLGWSIVLSLVQTLLFNVRRLAEVILKPSSRIDASPQSQEILTGYTATFDAASILKRGHTRRWVKETASGDVQILENETEPTLRVRATTEAAGSKYKLVIVDSEGEKVDESLQAELLLAD